MTYKSIFPELLLLNRHKVLSPKIKISIPRMVRGVRNNKRVREATQSDVLPSESEPRRSKRLLAHEHTTPSDDNAAAEECNGTVAHDNTSKEGNEAAAHDNAVVEQHIGAPNDDHSFPEGKLYFFHLLTSSLLLFLKVLNDLTKRKFLFCSC
jgi:hypothetical protein